MPRFEKIRFDRACFGERGSLPPADENILFTHLHKGDYEHSRSRDECIVFTSFGRIGVYMPKIILTRTSSVYSFLKVEGDAIYISER